MTSAQRASRRRRSISASSSDRLLRSNVSYIRPRCESLSPIVGKIALVIMLPLSIGLVLTSFGLGIMSLIPFLGFGAVTALICLLPMTIYSIAWTIYLLLAQQDRPSHSLMGTPALARLIPFLPLAPWRCWKVAKATLSYLASWLRYSTLARGWLLTYLMYAKERDNENLIYDAIPYAIPFFHQVLDVYPPPRSFRDAKQSKNKTLNHYGTYQGAPVLVLVPTPIVPVRLLSHRKAYLQIAIRLRNSGYCVVVPDIQYYPNASIRDSVGDLRLALSWVGAHIASYGGNPAAIYTMGFGLSAHLVSLTLVQEAVALSQTVALHTASTMGLEDLESRLDRSRVQNFESYLPQVRLPQLAGVILVAPLIDVVKGYRHEMALGVEHLSYLRRSTGPTHAQCLSHSPSHLLQESKGSLDASFLPPKFLLIHGGNDRMIPLYHSALFKTLLDEAGVAKVELRAYRTLRHFEALACLALPASPYASQIFADLRDFIC
ncbi:hypothetical protein MPSI1_001354 [Malassezia psittaci]|uniref:BD-FAE-like domain-containing protein n=1 Tax=Malassezia psittaci TaxID=1821823 RepID=A0AAF0JJN8_9BASI|nr:hypothetical protein MPSI1_001354 [Malassezia psittaci]